MFSQLSSKGISVPYGFAITSDAYWYHLKANNIFQQIEDLCKNLNSDNSLENIQSIGLKIRHLISSHNLPADVHTQIESAYKILSSKYNQNTVDVAVRSSATAEDLPTASFAGQQDTFLNINNLEDLFLAIKNCMASLFTDRAISYRIEKGFDHMKIALSVGIQKMVRSDLASSGVNVYIRYRNRI